MNAYRDFLLELGLKSEDITIDMENKLKLMLSLREVTKPLVIRDKKILSLDGLAIKYRISLNVVKRMLY